MTITGSIVLILGTGFWMPFWASMGVDRPSATGGTYLNEVIRQQRPNRR